MIKKRNLDPSLVQWIMTQTGLGPGIGEIFWVAPDRSATSQFRTQLENQGITDIDTTIAAAEDRCVAYRNDIVMVFPGTYTVTESLTWDKANTHLIGIGALNRGGMGSTVYVNNATADVEQVIKVDGHNCQFHNMYLRNAGADAQCYTALKVHKGENFYAENCQFVGHAAATQVDTAATSSLWFFIDATGKPWGANFKNCRIGSASETIRTAGAVIYISGSAALAPKYITFTDCTIESYSDTAACEAVHIAASNSSDRYMLFKDCLFYNFSVNHATSMTEVFVDDSGSTHEVLLMGSTCAMGYTSWDNGGIGYIYADRFADAAGSHLMEVATTG